MYSKIFGTFANHNYQIPWELVSISVFFVVLDTPLYTLLGGTWFNESNNSHGRLVPFVSLYLGWMLKQEIKATEFRS